MLMPGTKTTMLAGRPKASLSRVLKSVFTRFLGVPKTVSEVRTIFRITQRHCLFSMLTFALMVQKQLWGNCWRLRTNQSSGSK